MSDHEFSISLVASKLHQSESVVVQIVSAYLRHMAESGWTLLNGKKKINVIHLPTGIMAEDNLMFRPDPSTPKNGK